MAGMQTQVNLIANEPGVYDGLSANFSGARLRRHDVQGRTRRRRKSFDAWVPRCRPRRHKLGVDAYTDLAKPSEKDPVQYFSAVEPVLFAAVLDKYMDKTTGLKLADKILPAQGRGQGYGVIDVMFGKLSWDAVPCHEPDRHGRRGR